LKKNHKFDLRGKIKNYINLGLDMFNIIIFIIINIINKFLKNIITGEKKHRFDLKGKIKNYYYY
jgi:hypothetical protein